MLLVVIFSNDIDDDDHLQQQHHAHHDQDAEQMMIEVDELKKAITFTLDVLIFIFNILLFTTNTDILRDNITGNLKLLQYTKKFISATTKQDSSRVETLLNLALAARIM